MFDSQQDVTQLRQELQNTQSRVQALRTELYRRRGQPAPPPEPQTSIEPGQSDENIKLQEALDQARKVALIYETELHRIAPTSPQVSRANQPYVHPTTGQQRGCLLSGWLILGAIADIRYLFTLAIGGGSSFFGAIFGAIIIIVALIGISGLWNLQRWGYYLLTCLYAAVILLNLVIMYSSVYAYFFGFINIAADLFNFGVLSLLVLIHWKKLE